MIKHLYVPWKAGQLVTTSSDRDLPLWATRQAIYSRFDGLDVGYLKEGAIGLVVETYNLCEGLPDWVKVLSPDGVVGWNTPKNFQVL